MYIATTLSISIICEHLDSVYRSSPSSWKKLAAAISSSTSPATTSNVLQPPL